ncbi:MAG: cytochrome-c peroxidase [Pirellulales bacterium]
MSRLLPAFRNLPILLLFAATTNLRAAEPSGTFKIDPRLRPLPAAAPAPTDNPTTPEKVALGKQLFFDPRLSGGNTMHCASCHKPDRQFADGTDWNKGEKGVTLVRNTQSCLNVGFYESFFWDGRAATLEEQALKPIEAEDEMNQPLDDLERELNAIPGYVEQFQNVFGEKPSRATVGKALAAYQRTLVTQPSKFDRFLLGDQTALSTDAKTRARTFPRGGSLHRVSPWADAQRRQVPPYGRVRRRPRPGQMDRPRGRSIYVPHAVVTKRRGDRPVHASRALQLARSSAGFLLQRQAGRIDRRPEARSTDLLHRELDDVDYLLAFLQSLTGETPDFTPPELPPGLNDAKPAKAAAKVASSP